MNKYHILAISTLSLFLLGCKKEAINQPVPPKAPPISTPVAVDTLALIEKAKMDMVNLPKPYNDKEDAQAKIDELVAQAKLENKKVFVQAGGNWCIYCLRFNDFIQNNKELQKIIDSNFLYYHLNYSKENKNEDVFYKYAPTGREYGFPFFFVIDQNGKPSEIISSETVTSDDDSYYDEQKTKAMFLKFVH